MFYAISRKFRINLSDKFSSRTVRYYMIGLSIVGILLLLLLVPVSGGVSKKMTFFQLRSLIELIWFGNSTLSWSTVDWFIIFSFSSYFGQFYIKL